MTGDPIRGFARKLVSRVSGRARTAPERPVIPHALLELETAGPVALSGHDAHQQTRLSIAIVIPSFRRGSGGHMTIANLARALGTRGHQVTLWLEDFEHLHAERPAATVADQFAEFFSPPTRLNTAFTAWTGADIVIATGWETVPRVLRLPGAGARAYLVQDHEPDFYGASAQALLAADTYRTGLHCIAASPWLADLLRSRYGAGASHFDLAVDHDLYRPDGRPRDQGHVVFYARTSTERRAVPLGLLALEELARRRPDVRIDLFGSPSAPYAPFPHTNLGVLAAADLADLYRRATVGIVFSLTNPSLIGLEMMACGLPCVELASPSMLHTFGADGPLRLAAADPLSILATVDGLLADPEARRTASEGGTRLMGIRTWARAAEQVESGLRRAMTSDADETR